MSRSSLFAVLALVSVTAACSSSEDGSPANPNQDAGGDVAVSDAPEGDTSTTDDAAPDTAAPDTSSPETGPGPVACSKGLPASFACAEPTKAAPKTTCTEALLQEFATTCITDSAEVPAACATWKTAHPECTTCIEDWSWDEDKIFVDDYQCYEALIPGCGKAMNCDLECPFEVCADCDDSPGTGSGGTSEFEECFVQATSAGGRCYEVSSKKSKECFDDPVGAPCRITSYYTDTSLTTLREEVVRVLRGACRDNGDWSKASEAGDAGT